MTFLTVQKCWAQDLDGGVRGKALDGMFQERLCINSRVVTDGERGRGRGRDGRRSGEGPGDEEQPYWQQHLRPVALRLSAVTGNRPGLQLHFINSPVLAGRARCSAALTNGRADFADLLRHKSSRLTSNLVKLQEIGVRFGNCAAEARAEDSRGMN